MKFTTVAVDKYGRWYDLVDSHPSWEQHKKGNDLVNIVVNAFTCEKSLAQKMAKQTKAKKGKK